MKHNNKIVGSVVVAALLSLGVTGCGNDTKTVEVEKIVKVEKIIGANASITEAKKSAALTTYADIALANYTDAFNDAKLLVNAIDSFTAKPTESTLNAAKTAWKTSRESYGTTEIFRLSNGPIDAEEGFAASWDAPEGQLNAWPLDENMIDYTTDASGALTSGNIIDTAGNFTPNGGDTVDVTTITKNAIADLNENGGDANVATGYHAVEFLLWGQDQDYADFTADTVTNGAGVAGQRAVTDFTSAANANRRIAYLKASAQLIVDDLEKMVTAWTDEENSYRRAFLGDGKNAIATDIALKQVFAGMGTFIKSELANERMAVAILTPSEEDEHSCFSDNTHRDISTNYQGFVNVLKGEYKGESKGESFYSVLTTDTKEGLDTLITSIDAKVKSMNDAVSAGENFDYQIKDGSDNKANLTNAKNSMRSLGDTMVDVAREYAISLSASDVQDGEETEL
ncbi:MAG: imelysin family protein [Campylobacterota bacterium]|nr:imelysin family protein [Campylobacterota bacterium]